MAISSEADAPVKVIKIEPDGKYLLVFQRELTNDQAAQLKHDLEQFVAGGFTFLVLMGGVKVVRVDEADDASGVSSE